jgi:hypothetical protein
MKTILPVSITTIDQAKAYVKELWDNGEIYHFDDRASSISGDPFEGHTRKMDSLRDQMYQLPGFDVFEYVIELQDAQSGLTAFRKGRRTVTNLTDVMDYMPGIGLKGIPPYALHIYPGGYWIAETIEGFAGADHQYKTSKEITPIVYSDIEPLEREIFEWK